MNSAEAELAQSSSTDDIERNFARLKSRFDVGELVCALHAVKFAWYFRVGVPDWALAHVGRGIQDWSDCEKRTLDEALGVKRPKGFRLDAGKKAAMLGGAILIAVNRRLESEPYSDDVFEGVGGDWGLGKTAAKEIYNGHMRMLEDRFPETHAKIIASRKNRKKPAVLNPR